jgi:hypothetical protein
VGRGHHGCRRWLRWGRCLLQMLTSTRQKLSEGGWHVCNIIRDKPRGALPRRHLCTFRILIPHYFVLYIMPLCHSAIPPFCHSAIPPFRHSTILPFRHSAIPSFRHSAILPFHHSAPIRNNAIYVSQEVLRKAVTLPGGLRSNRYVPPLQAK